MQIEDQAAQIVDFDSDDDLDIVCGNLVDGIAVHVNRLGRLDETAT